MKIYTGNITRKIYDSRRKAEGFSLIELVIVLVIIGVLSAISLPYIFSYRTLYRSEEQSLKITDLMKETSQLALTRRRTFRLEIDVTANQLLIIDEDKPGAGDDTQIKAVPFEAPDELRIRDTPSSVSVPTPPAYNAAVFANDTTGHLVGATTVINNFVWAARFRSDGTVVNSAGIPVSATIFVWPPSASGAPTARSLTEVRAITIFGGTGVVRYWKYDGTKFLPN